jgi:hypothetical protein
MSNLITQSLVAETIQMKVTASKTSAIIEKKCIDTIGRIIKCFGLGGWASWSWEESYVYGGEGVGEFSNFSLLSNIRVNDRVVTYFIGSGSIDFLSRAGVKYDLSVNFPIEWLFLGKREVSRLLTEGREAAISRKEYVKAVSAQKRLSNKEAKQKAKESAVAKLTREEARLAKKADAHSRHLLKKKEGEKLLHRHKAAVTASRAERRALGAERGAV